MIAFANSTAILFDHNTEMVKPVEFDGELESLRTLLKIPCIDTIRLDPDHVVYVDDTGFMDKIETGFALTYRGRRIEWAGSGLLAGCSNGENAPITLDLPELKIDVLKFKYE